MKVVVTYTYTTHQKEWSQTTRSGNTYSGVCQYKSYEDLNITIEQVEENELLLTIKNLLNKGTIYDNIKDIKSLFDIKDVYTFKDGKVEIYYENDPPDHLYILINNKDDAGYYDGGTYNHYLPTEIHTHKKPSKSEYNDLLLYTFDADTETYEKV